MVERMFWVRYNLAPPNDEGKHTHEERVNWAATADNTTSANAWE